MKQNTILFNAVLLIILSFFNICCGQGKSMDISKFDEATRGALQSLQKVNTFAMGPVGYAGTTSESEKSAQMLALQPDANEAFQWLLQNGSPEAKLYALWGLRKVNGRRSGKFFEPFRNSAQKVKVMEGCEIFDDLIKNQINNIESPFYLKTKTQELWRMEPERKKSLLTLEEQKFLTAIFRLHKGNDFNTLDEIAEIPFGELFAKEADRLLGKAGVSETNEFKTDELMTHLDKAWNNVEKPTGGSVLSWEMVVSPPFPSSWKEGENLTWTRYAYARGMDYNLNDGVRVSKVWAKVIFNPATNLAKLEIVSPKLEDNGVQGVKTISKDWLDILSRQNKVSESLVKIGKMPNLNTEEMVKAKEFYGLWFRCNGVSGIAFQNNHRDFFRWFDTTQKSS